MRLDESKRCSFVVKVWIEETEAEQATWRGHVTHVFSGRRRYLQNLDEIAVFVRPYLEAMGVRFEPGQVSVDVNELGIVLKEDDPCRLH
jgi:hypothetical protein